MRHRLKSDSTSNVPSMTAIMESSRTKVRSKKQLLQIIDTTLLKCYLQVLRTFQKCYSRYRRFYFFYFNFCFVQKVFTFKQNLFTSILVFGNKYFLGIIKYVRVLHGFLYLSLFRNYFKVIKCNGILH